MSKEKQFVFPTYESLAESCDNLSEESYIKSDISDEEYREVELENGRVYRISEPLMLVFRKGGSTHRVVDRYGVVHCYAAPESGKVAIRWKSRTKTPIQF